MATSGVELETGSDEVEKCCDPCKLSGSRNVAVVYCRTCGQFQCSACNRVHKLIPALTKHSIVDAGDDAAGKEKFNMQNLDQCKTHKKRFEFYCVVDNELCCSSCIISSHNHKHGNVVDIDTLTGKNAENVKKFKIQLMSQRLSLTRLASTASNIKSNLRTTQAANKLQQIDQAKQTFIRMFDDFMTEFKTKTDTVIDDIEKDMDTRLTLCDQINEDRDSMEAFLDSATSEGTPRQVFTTLHIYKKRTKRFDGELDQGLEQLSTLSMDFRFDKKIMSCFGVSETIGEISIIKTKYDNKTIALPEPLKLTQAASLYFFAEDEGEKEIFYTGLDIMPDGKIIAVDNYNSKLVIMDGHLLTIGRAKLDNSPKDVAVMPGNKIAVSYGRQLNIYRVNDKNTLTRVKTIRTYSQFDSLYALDDKTFIASTYGTEGPAKLVSITGIELDFNLPWQRTKFTKDQCRTTYIPALHMLVLTDERADTCYLWNVRDKTKIVVEDGRIRSPRGVCATRSGIIFVCSFLTNSIVQISPTGTILTSTRLSAKGPYSVAVSLDDKRLAVSCYSRRDRILQLFNIT